MTIMPLKTKLFSFIFLLFLGFNLSAKTDATKTKKVSKTIQVSKDHLLEIANKFGEVKISTWDQNQIQVDVTISITSKNDDKSQKRLDNIEIEIKEENGHTSFITSFDENKNINLNDNNKMSIDYVVKMPKNISLKVKNSFGGFALSDFDGKTDITVEFGSATIGKLNNAENDLTFKFSKPVVINHIEKGDVTVKYSDLDLSSAKTLNLFSEFSGPEIGTVNDLDLTLKFGSLKLDKVNNLDLACNMASVDIKELTGKGDLKPKYGSLEIDKVSKGFTSLEVKSEFTPIDITIEEGSAIEADLYCSMCKLDVPNGKWTEHIKENNKESYKGTFGEGAKKMVKIRSSFGSVDLDF